MSLDYRRIYSPCYPEEPSPTPFSPVQTTEKSSDRKISNLTSIDNIILDNDDFTKRLFNGSDSADQYIY